MEPTLQPLSFAQDDVEERGAQYGGREKLVQRSSPRRQSCVSVSLQKQKDLAACTFQQRRVASPPTATLAAQMLEC
jgi:hypothetical protein